MNDAKRKWLTLLAMSLALAMVFLDQSALPIALPQIQKHLNTSNIMLQWVVNAYMLAIAAVIIFGGKVGDVIGARKAFLGGVIIFIVASILCALSPNITTLILARAVQGIGGAFMIPATSVIVLNAVEVSERGKLMGIFVGSAAIFIVLGPLLGGVLTQYLSWRWIFGLNFPITLLVIALTLLVVPGKSAEKTDETLDWSGFFLSSLGLCAFVFALMESSDLGIGSPIVMSSLIIFLLSMTAFHFVQQRKQYPLVDYSLFKNMDLRTAILCLLLVQITFIATIYWPIFHQDVLRFSPAMAGLLAMPGVIPVMFAPTIGGRLFDRYGPQLPVRIGTIGIALSAVWVGAFAFTHNYWWMLPGYFIFGCSAPLTVLSSMSTAVTTVDASKRGLASGLASGSRRLGGALGIAAISTMIASIDKWYIGRFLQQAPENLREISYQQLNGMLAHTSAAQAATQHLPAADVNTLMRVAIDAYTLGFSCGMFTLAAVALIAFVIAKKLPNKPLTI